jgi:hypothetical protein
VEKKGIEPSTVALQKRCSPVELLPLTVTPGTRVECLCVPTTPAPFHAVRNLSKAMDAG